VRGGEETRAQPRQPQTFCNLDGHAALDSISIKYRDKGTQLQTRSIPMHLSIRSGHMHDGDSTHGKICEKKGQCERRSFSSNMTRYHM
jgi:hypothetical protein